MTVARPTVSDILSGTVYVYDQQMVQRPYRYSAWRMVGMLLQLRKRVDGATTRDYWDLCIGVAAAALALCSLSICVISTAHQIRLLVVVSFVGVSLSSMHTVTRIMQRWAMTFMHDDIRLNKCPACGYSLVLGPSDQKGCSECGAQWLNE